MIRYRLRLRYMDSSTPCALPCAFVLTAVPGLFALCEGDFDLGDAVPKIDLQGMTVNLGLGAAREFRISRLWRRSLREPSGSGPGPPANTVQCAR